MISLDKVSVTKGGRTILRDISLELAGKRIGVIGQNGSGKSIFSKLLNGLETCSEGEVRFNGVSVTPVQMRKLVGFVFQLPDNQIVFPLVDDDIAFGLKKSGLSRAEISRRVQSYLARFGLSHLAGRLTHELSGGEKQLVALVGVLIMNPEVIVLDEPTTLLDLKNRLMLIEALRELEQTLIIASHDLEFMMEMDKVVLLHGKTVHKFGDPASVIDDYRKLSQC